MHSTETKQSKPCIKTKVNSNTNTEENPITTEQTKEKRQRSLVQPPDINCSSNATNHLLPRRNRKCALSATGMRKPEEEKDARGVTCFIEENETSFREVARFDEHKRD